MSNKPRRPLVKFFLVSIMNKFDIIDRYIWLTSVVIAALVLLVPIGAYLLTGNGSYLHPIHFLLAVAIGLLQFIVIHRFKRDIKEFWDSLRRSFEFLKDSLNRVRKRDDILQLREKKDQILRPWFKEKHMETVGKGLNELVDQVLDILEINLLKDDLIRKLTTTLDVRKLSHILTSNLLRIFNLPAAAVYLRSVRGEELELKMVKGFKELKPVLGKEFTDKVLSLERNLIEENLPWLVDYGLLDRRADKVLIYKLQPRKEKTVGLVFLALPENFSPSDRRVLEKLLLDIHTTLSLIFENAIEHEKSVLMASFDPLTGAYNRREGYRLITSLLKRATLERKNVCLLVLDLDDFKKINDTYGHHVGDIVLKELVKNIRRSIRSEEDIVVRWGGEEFIVAVYNVPPEKAYEIAERIRKRVENNLIKLDNNLVLKPTVSIGVACSEKEGTYMFEELFSIADKRLYKAKKQGKNRVVVR